MEATGPWGPRRRPTYDALLRGLRDCLWDDETAPTSYRIAERAGVSRRAVFRHCAHVEELYAGLYRVEYERLLATEPPFPADEDLSSRVRELVRRRAHRHQELAPLHRSAQCLNAACPTLVEQLERIRRHGREEVKAAFAPELEPLARTTRRTAVAAISSALGWSTWEELRRYGELPEPAARRATERLVACAVPRAATSADVPHFLAESRALRAAASP